MKPLTKIAIATAAVALLAATMQPAEAACSVPKLINTGNTYLVSNPDWGAASTGGDGSCTTDYGCYESESGPPITDGIGGTFWAWAEGAPEGGDSTYFVGTDNGTWEASQWTKQISLPYAGGLYHFQAWITLPGGVPYISGFVPNWGASFEIDGCTTDITPTIDNDECTCMLLTDEWNGQGYFLAFSAVNIGNGNFNFDRFEHVNMAPIPTPSVAMSERDDATGDVLFSVNVPALPAAGDYRQDGCHCDLGFRVYAQLTGREGAPPAGRRSCSPTDYQNDAAFDGTAASIRQVCQGRGLNWIPAQAAAGGPQAPTPFGQTATVRVDCDPAVQSDVYLSTEIVGDSVGVMSGRHVSGNSFRVECGANVVDDPTRPDRDQGQSDEAPRGRDENRGRGNATGRR
ncbi:MAG TPA: hypothetical protein VD788_15075 [Candidatus Polarisedimenticolaceae bacterium]|nr:hypothetical protein [Candidatus Polarisedimenticolaceae bacterium]